MKMWWVGHCLDHFVLAGCRQACGLSSLFQRDRNNFHTRLLTLMSFRQTLAVSRTRSNTLTSSCPCARCRPLIVSIEPSFVSLACAVEVVALAHPENENCKNFIKKNSFFIKCN